MGVGIYFLIKEEEDLEDIPHSDKQNTLAGLFMSKATALDDKDSVAGQLMNPEPQPYPIAEMFMGKEHPPVKVEVDVDWNKNESCQGE